MLYDGLSEEGGMLGKLCIEEFKMGIETTISGKEYPTILKGSYFKGNHPMHPQYGIYNKLPKEKQPNKALRLSTEWITVQPKGD